MIYIYQKLISTKILQAILISFLLNILIYTISYFVPNPFYNPMVLFYMILLSFVFIFGGVDAVGTFSSFEYAHYIPFIFISIIIATCLLKSKYIYWGYVVVIPICIITIFLMLQYFPLVH